MSPRLGLALGLALASAIAVWWLGASRIAIEGGAGTTVVAGNALFVLLLSRAMLVALLAPRTAAVGGYLAALRASLPVVSVAWPVVVLAWAASDDEVLHTVMAELGLLAGAVLMPLVGRGLARLMKQGTLLESVATAAGVVTACGLWLVAIHGV